MGKNVYQLYLIKDLYIVKVTSNQITKWTKHMNKCFSKEGIQMPNKQKIDTKHVQSSEKCKSKSQLFNITALLMGTIKKTDHEPWQVCGGIRNLMHGW